MLNSAALTLKGFITVLSNNIATKATCGHRALKMWLIQTEMCYKIQARFLRLVEMRRM